MMWRSYPITAAGPRWIFTTFPLGPSGRTPAIASYSLFNARSYSPGQNGQYTRPARHLSRKIRNHFNTMHHEAEKRLAACELYLNRLPRSVQPAGARALPVRGEFYSFGNGDATGGQFVH
jgi:hypothetical protein